MPWDDKPKKVDNSREKMAHVNAAFKKFEGSRYYPANPAAVIERCKGFADIVQDRPLGELYDREQYPDGHPNLGHVEDVNDIDWLVKRALARFEFCPSLKELRNMYCRYFTPADGVMISEREEE